MFISSLPFSVEYVYGDGYDLISFNKVKHFDPFLFIILIMTVLLKIVNLGFSYSAIFGRD